MISITSLRNYIFYLCLVILYAYGVFIGSLGGNPEGGIYWMLMAVSVCLFLVCLVHIFIASNFRLDLTTIAILFVLSFCAIYALLVHGDSGVINILFLFVYIASVIRFPVPALYSFVNVLFIFSIFFSILTYHLGLNIWGYLPGQATTNLHEGLWWRVSVFPFQTPPASGVFSLIVLHNNIVNRGRFSTVFVFLALYFALFSASRTVLLALMLYAFYMMFLRRVRFRSIYVFLMVTASIVIVGILSFYPFVIYKFISSQDVLSSLILRSGGSSQSASNPDTRAVMALSFMDLIIAYWPFGVGAKGIAELYSGPGGSEMAAFRLIAAYGIFGVVALIAFVFILSYKTTSANVFFIIFFVFLFFYSSFLAPYNFIFLIMLSVFSSRAELRPHMAFEKYKCLKV